MEQTFWKVFAGWSIAFSFATSLILLTSEVPLWLRYIAAFTIGLHFLMAMEYGKCSHSSTD